MFVSPRFLAAAVILTGVVFPSQGAEENFHPVIRSARLLHDTVRPGEPLIVELTFANTGTDAPGIQYGGFLHLEREKTDPSCTTVGALMDFGVDWWKSGSPTYHGIYSITVPPSFPEGKRYLHTGLFLGEKRLCETTLPFTVDSAAPPQAKPQASALAPDELARRRDACEHYFTAARATLESERLAFAVAADGRWQLTDKTTGTVWRSNLAGPAFGLLLFEKDGVKLRHAVDHPEFVTTTAHEIVFDSRIPEVGVVRFTLTMRADGRSFTVKWQQTGGPAQLTGCIFPDEALAATGEEGGTLIVPNRLGLLIPAAENLPTKMSFLTYAGYGGLSMAMAGVRRDTGGVLLWWDDVDTALTARRSWDDPNLPGATGVDLTLSHQGRTGMVGIAVPGTGDTCKIVNAYRDIAREKGLLVTMREKYGDDNPIDGVMSFRPMAYFNFKPNTRWNETDQPVSYVGFTFDEIARTTEYLKRDLGLSKVMITIMGWGEFGYDHRHPDVLPAAPAAGGNDGLRDCVKRIRDLGYLIGLHDNYGDFYADAPSFRDDYIMRNQDGSLHQGGVWWGGQSYLANPVWSLYFAKRNLPRIKELFPLNYYYIDTTFAVPLEQDYNPADPMSRAEDMRRKQALCRYAHEQFGLFGSEEGVEWGVPVADYAESMLFQRTQRQSGEILAPLFEMVYGDAFVVCEGDRTLPTTPTYVLDHLICAEMPQTLFNLYPECGIRSQLTGARFVSDTELEMDLTYCATGGVPAEDYRSFIHLDRAGRSIGNTAEAIAGADFIVDPVPSTWKPDQPVADRPRRIALDRTKDGRYDVFTGMLDGHTRIMMQGAVDMGNTRYLIGHLTVKDGEVTVEAPQPPPESCFSRRDAQPELSYTNEGFLRNLDAIFTPLMRRTRDTPMTGHRFPTADRKVEESKFGDVTITVNYGDAPYDTGRFVLPKWGFSVESPDFLAFRADAADGKKFTTTTMLTVEHRNGETTVNRIYGDDVTPDLTEPIDR